MVDYSEILNHFIQHEKCPTNFPEMLESSTTYPLLKDLFNNKSKFKAFPGINGKYPSEVVSKINKAKLRKEVIASIKSYCFSKGLPYIHLWYYPAPYKTAFAFRVDSDGYERESFFNVFQIAQKHGMRMSWFIDVGAQRENLDDAVSIYQAGQEVQLHCYKHQTYPDFQQNYENIKKGKEILEKSRIPVAGFVAPFGSWNLGLNEALEKLGFLYSSEFSLSYDDLPFYPIVNGRVSKVLQIPIHPICIGTLIEAGYTADEMKEYFRRVIDSKLTERAPILLYGHPIARMNKYPDVVDFIFSYIKQKENVWYLTFNEFAKWWIERLAIDFRAIFHNDNLIIESNNVDERFLLRIEASNSQEAFIPLKSCRIHLRDLPWEIIEKVEATPPSEIDRWLIHPILMKRKYHRKLGRLKRNIVAMLKSNEGR